MRAGNRLKLPVPALAALLGGGVLVAQSPAQAYCLTTTCDTQSDGCNTDENGCSSSGIPLKWDSLCMYYGVQQDGSQRRNIDAGVVADLMEQSFDTWMNADCGSGSPPFVVQSIGEVECNEPEFNCESEDPNSNTVMFRDDTWHYDPAALAITTLTVDVRDGTILDADMEVNSRGFDFSVGDVLVNNDLLSVLTHESGHFLGLSHSNVDGSTMYPGYSSREITQRSLDPDDIAGICEIFPPDGRLSCRLEVPSSTECVGGSECSGSAASNKKQTRTCSLSSAPGMDRGWAPIVLLGLLIAAIRRRRS